MMSRHFSPAATLPKGWSQHTRSALIHAVSLVAAAWTLTRIRAATSRSQRRRSQAELGRAASCRGPIPHPLPSFTLPSFTLPSFTLPSFAISI
jgi:hypothetical protein